MVAANTGDRRQCRATGLGWLKSCLDKVSNMRVLLFADHCNPEFSSEPLVGYNTCRSIAGQVDEAVVVTQIRNRDAIERAGMAGAEVVYLDTEYVARPVWKISKALRLGADSGTAMKAITQYFFERDLWRRFGPDLVAGRFDIVHRVTPISSAIPCPLASWSPTPLVIGPVNGGLPYPAQFGSVRRKEGEWLRYIRGGWRPIPPCAAALGKTHINARGICSPGPPGRARLTAVKPSTNRSGPCPRHSEPDGTPLDQFEGRRRIVSITFETLPRGLPRPTPGVSVTASTTRGRKRLICQPHQAIFASNDRPAGECRFQV